MTGRQLEPRSDGRRKASGQALYTSDIQPHGLLHGAIVRPPIPAGRVVAVDFSAALASPGVVRVLGPDDVPDTLFGGVRQDERLLAREVRYVGEPVALIAAETASLAEQAARLVVVDIQPRPHATT